MPEPTITAVLQSLSTVINSTVTVTKFVYELKNTPEDVKTCLDLVKRVYDDIQYAVSLRDKHRKCLCSNPERLKRLDGIIADANQSIMDVGRLLEGCRRDAHGGQVPMKGRMKWVMSDSVAFGRRTANLQQQHAAINVEIGFLEQLGALQPVQDFVRSNTTFENLELLSMGRRKSSSKLSTFGQIDLIDLNPPPEYAPPVPPHSYDEQAAEFVIDPGRGVPEIAAHDVSIPRGFQSSAVANHGTAVEENIEDEDPEVAFYREMRQQEEERRERLAGMRN